MMCGQKLVVGVCVRRIKDAILIDRVKMRPDHAVPKRCWNATELSSRGFLSPNIHPLRLPFLTLLLDDLESGEPSPLVSSSDCLLRSLC